MDKMSDLLNSLLVSVADNDMDGDRRSREGP